jgi:hypothetical protein
MLTRGASGKGLYKIAKKWLKTTKKLKKMKYPVDNYRSKRLIVVLHTIMMQKIRLLCYFSIAQSTRGILILRCNK